jgi:hypothetical protein
MDMVRRRTLQHTDIVERRRSASIRWRYRPNRRGDTLAFSNTSYWSGWLVPTATTRRMQHGASLRLRAGLAGIRALEGVRTGARGGEAVKQPQ